LRKAAKSTVPVEQLAGELAALGWREIKDAAADGGLDVEALLSGVCAGPAKDGQARAGVGRRVGDWELSHVLRFGLEVSAALDSGERHKTRPRQRAVE